MSPHPSLCSDHCRPSHHIHTCQQCGKEFTSQRSNTRYCPPLPGTPSRLSDCAAKAWAARKEKLCAYVFSDGTACPKKAMPGLRDGFCEAHHRRSVNGQDMNKPFRQSRAGTCTICAEQGRSEPVYAKGLCSLHYDRQLTGRRLRAPRVDRKAGVLQCSVTDADGTRCENKVRANGLCDMHNQRLRTTGSVGPARPLRAKRGEGHLNSRGYVEMQRNGVKRHQHLLVADEMLGEPVDTNRFEVHHKNGVRSDNRPENLEVVPIGHGAGQHFEDLVPFIVEHGLHDIYLRDGSTENFPSWARKT